MTGFREQFRTCKKEGMVIDDPIPGRWFAEDWGTFNMCLVFGGFCHSKKCLQRRRDVGKITGVSIKIHGEKNK